MEKGKFIFDTFKEWDTYAWSACKHLAKGVARILFALFFGMVSIFVFCGKQIEAFCRREPVASGLVGMLTLLLIVGWIATYVNGRAATKTAEFQRDSIGYKLDKYMQAYDTSEAVVIENDTIRYGSKVLP